jgi:hypothetical protein
VNVKGYRRAAGGAGFTTALDRDAFSSKIETLRISAGLSPWVF